MSADDLSRRRGPDGRFLPREGELPADDPVRISRVEPLPQPDEAPPPSENVVPEKIEPDRRTHHSLGIGRLLTRTSRILLWIAGIVVILLAAVLIFLAQTDWDWFRPTVASILSGRLHRPVRIDGHLRAHLLSWNPSAEVEGLKIGEPAQGVDGVPAADLADIDRLAVTTELMPLFIGRVVLPRLEIDRPLVTLFQDRQGHANWDFSGGESKPTRLPPIKYFIINDGHLTMTSLQRRLAFTGTVQAHEKADGANAQAFALTGQGTLNKKVFLMNATGGPLLNVRTDTPYPFDMTIHAGDSRITAKGRVTHPFNLGQMDAAVSLSGHNLADLYYLTGLTLPNTPAYMLTAQVGRDNQTYRIDKINGRVGSSDLEGRLKVDISRHGRPDLSGDLSSRVLDVKDLGSLFGATAANTPTAPKLKAAPQAVQVARRLLPDAPLDVERVRGMDAAVRYHAQSVRSLGSMPLQQVDLGVKLDHGLLVLDPVDVSFPRGRLQGSAQIDARNAVQRDTVDLRLTGLAVQDLVPKFQGSPPLEGVLNARVRAAGTGNSVHKAAATASGEMTLLMPGGTIRQSFAELMGIDASKGLFMLLAKDPHQTDIRCAIADFRIQDGVMQAQNITFDTGVVRVNGLGNVNLNDETLKLTFKGKAKQFRLIRVNAPILIGGHLAAPTFGIDAGPAVAQSGFAAVLGSVAAPLLSLPFVNLNGAQDANCASLIAEAHTQGAPTTVHPLAKPKRHR